MSHMYSHPLVCSFSFGKIWKSDNLSRSNMVHKPRKCNSGINFLQFFSYLCNVECCHFEGYTAPCEEKLLTSSFQLSQCFRWVASLAVQGLPFHFFFIQVHGDLFRLSITNTCSPTPTSNDAITLLSINNFHLPVHVDQRNIFCSQELYNCMLLHLHSHIHTILSHM